MVLENPQRTSAKMPIAKSKKQLSTRASKAKPQRKPNKISEKKEDFLSTKTTTSKTDKFKKPANDVSIPFKSFFKIMGQKIHNKDPMSAALIPLRFLSRKAITSVDKDPQKALR